MSGEVRYGTPMRYKTVHFSDYDVAKNFYEKAKRFATNHNLNWTIALFREDGWLVMSEHIMIGD